MSRTRARLRASLEWEVRYARHLAFAHLLSAARGDVARLLTTSRELRFALRRALDLDAETRRLR